MKNNWLFIHGGWGGSWQWTPLRDELSRKNILSFAPDLPGMGEKDCSGITLDHFVDCASEIILSQTEPMNIAAFSFGGLTATALAGKYPGRINRLVYIDAFVPEPGQSFADIAGERICRQIKAYTEIMGESRTIPPFFESDRRYRSHPLNTLFTKVHYQKEDLSNLNPLYIECTDKNPQWAFTSLLNKTARAARKKNWRVKTIHSDHMPMYSHWRELISILTTEWDKTDRHYPC